ncbi:MAG: AarF/UbiB family protein [Candidatus Binatus sp.]|jgi:aarF domain-containing kinase|uniref:ABC1 kinase family protein n=1 Tax=Candidatus Binatus sp. TaxID=2811406 RepID=UPI003CA68103
MSNPSIDRSFDFPADVPEPGLATRVWRFGNVVWLAVYVYAGYKATQLWTRLVSDRNKAELYRRQDLRAAQALNRTSIRLEGLLIKACQFIATRADVLPDEWVSTLSGLHDRVPPRPFAMIREQIERELRQPLEEVYAEFDPVPLASASLAQVHQARLHDGRRCAVKVQYPGIDGIVRADLRNMTLVLRWLAMLEPDFDYRVLMREALKYIPMELDFDHEADNSATMRRNFAADRDVMVPEVYREFTTRRVLTMELADGIKVTDVDALGRAGIDKHAVAQKLIEIFCDQVLRDGFFHADPHPGNILVQPGPRIVLLDFGLAKDFPPAFRDGIVRLTFSILTSNRDGIAAAFKELGFRTRTGNPDTLLAFADAFLGSTIKSKKAYADKDMVEKFSEELPRAIRANPVVEVPADVLLVGRMMGLLSGLGKTLDSQVDLFATIMPYAQRLMMAQPAPAPAADAPTDTPAGK